jgi:hypothetical protein
MRLAYLPAIAMLAMAVPAFAGTDDGDAPNPFTAPSTGQTSTSGLTAGTDTTARPPNVPAAGQGSDFDGRQPTRADEAKSSDSIYQAPKKDGDDN